jgi:SAM-dependent methyltransferase
LRPLGVLVLAADLPMPRARRLAPSDFDAAYYERFYERRATRVQGPKEVAHLAKGITGVIDWLGGRIETVLDVGAGTGLWRDWFAAHRPGAAYRSVDVSPYACERYGHEWRDIARWKARGRFDLVVCQGVLPYLDERDAEAAIDNLGAMTRGFLYLEAVTDLDLATVCDRELTDPAMKPRRGAWYRERLAPHYVPLALGLWMSKRFDAQLYELERGG